MIVPSQRQCGLSVLEVVVALAVALLMACVVLPTAASTLQRVRVAHVQGELGEAFLLSARHAASAGVATVLCPSAEPPGCGEGHDWSAGWLAFADLDGDRRFGAGDTLLRRAPAVSGGLRVYGTPGRTRLVFQPHGGSAGSNASFTVCAGSRQRLGRLVLSNTGQFRWSGRIPGAAEACEMH